MRSLIVALASLVCLATEAKDLPVRPLDSVLFLTKNTNNNQVHYGVNVDKQCRPAVEDPVYAYWRMLEEGPDERDKLKFWEQPGYGVRQPEKVDLNTDSGSLALVIRGVPEHKIRLETFSSELGCRARAITGISGEEAILLRIDIDVSGWADVHKVEIHGISLHSGLEVSEVTHQD
jgi:hypothetical protein